MIHYTSRETFASLIARASGVTEFLWFGLKLDVQKITFAIKAGLDSCFVKYVQLNFYRSTVKIKASYASMESVSHAEFWNSAAFATMPEGASYGQEGRMEEWSREILR